MPPTLRAASEFTIEELTDAYNQTRVDYMVPMPMNAARLAEYVRVYDIDMDKSFVALDGEQMLGLGMLGVRHRRTWITRLGILPALRRMGAGEAIMRKMIHESDEMEIRLLILEVIKDNVPAHTLFLKLGFRETRELLILRRAPGPPDFTPQSRVAWLDKEEAMTLLPTRPQYQAWTNQPESLSNATKIMGLRVELKNGDCGWMVFQKQRFMLSRLMFETQSGDAEVVGRELLGHLHHQYPRMDTYTENIPTYDLHLNAFTDLGYFEAFSRIEMYRRA